MSYFTYAFLMLFTSFITFVRFPGLWWWHGRGKLIIVLLFHFLQGDPLFINKIEIVKSAFLGFLFYAVVQKQLQFTSYILSEEVVVKLVWESVCYHKNLGVKAKSKFNAYNLELQPCTILSLVCCIFWENHFNQAAFIFHQNPSLRKMKRKSFGADAEEEGENQGMSVGLSVILFVCL